METATIEDPAGVEAALLSHLLVPPPAPASLQPGPVADLRDSMARFSGSDTHAARRSVLDALVDQIEDHAFAAEGHRRTVAIIEGSAPAQGLDGLADIGFVVPVEVVSSALGVTGEVLADVRGEVRSVAEVIGRQQPSTPTADEAAARLLRRFDAMGVDSIGAVSLLYQTHDATAALFASALVCEQTGTMRRSAISATGRTATAPVTIGGLELGVGDSVVLDLERSRFEFGLGHHRCPGRQIAERIVSGMIHAVSSAGVRVDTDAIERHNDGRPRTLPINFGDDQT
ncbi:MAG: hypothetical protein AAF078_09690 [Planctomycetota bacterium]